METNEYINELEKSLKKYNIESKDEILKEIKSYINEKNAKYSELCEKFGMPENFAKSYIDEEQSKELVKPISLWSKFFIFMGVLLLIIILVMFYMSYIFTSDQFDYSKYTNKQ